MAGQDRPALFPRWTTDPPAIGTHITEPTSDQKDSGWQDEGSAEFPDGKPIRQIMNWLQNFGFQWNKWLDQSKHTIDDFSPSQVLPITGVVPTTGAGRVIASGDFSAAVYAGIPATVYRVPLTALADPPATGGSFTYPATSDTYWDLRQDCVWVATSVPAMDPAPAVAANATRVYAVRTDATDRTSVILDLMTGSTHLWFDKAIRAIGDLMVAGQLEIGAQTDDDAPAGDGTPPDFDAFTPRVIGTGRGFSGEVRWQISEFDNESSGIQILRTYVGALQNRNQVELVWGARCTGNSGNNWITDSNASDAFRIVLGGDDIQNLNQIRFESIIGIGTSTTFSDSDWSDQGFAGQLSQANMPGGLRLGAELNDDVDSSVNSVAHIEHVSKTGGVASEYTLIREDKSGAQTVREYVSLDFFVGAAGNVAYVRTSNARFDEATTLWVRDDNGISAFMYVDTIVGRQTFTHLIGDANTWSDIGAAPDWTLIESLGVLSSAIQHRLANVSGGGIDSGFYQGYGSLTRGCRKIFGIEGAIIGSGDFAASEDQFGHTLAGANPARFPAGSITADKDLFLPIMIPHEAVVTAAAVLHTSGAADNLQVEFVRLDTQEVTTSYRESLMSGGPDTTWTNTGAAARLFETLTGLNSNLTIDNQRYRYGLSILLDFSASGNVVLYGARVDFDVRYLSGSM